MQCEANLRLVDHELVTLFVGSVQSVWTSATPSGGPPHPDPDPDSDSGSPSKGSGGAGPRDSPQHGSSRRRASVEEQLAAAAELSVLLPTDGSPRVLASFLKVSCLVLSRLVAMGWRHRADIWQSLTLVQVTGWMGGAVGGPRATVSGAASVRVVRVTSPVTLVVAFILRLLRRARWS